jgi:hypothetical protein
MSEIPSAGSPTPPGRAVEYFVVEIEVKTMTNEQLTAVLNGYGAGGWQLISFSNHANVEGSPSIAVFMREGAVIA